MTALTVAIKIMLIEINQYTQTISYYYQQIMICFTVYCYKQPYFTYIFSTKLRHKSSTNHTTLPLKSPIKIL